MEGFNQFLREFFVLFLEGLQVSPLIGIQEVEKIEQFPDVIIQGRLRR